MTASSNVTTGSILDHNNPLKNEICLFLQLKTFQELLTPVIVTLSRSIGYFLRKLNQPAVIAEVIGGIMLGPTVFSRIPGFKDAVGFDLLVASPPSHSSKAIT